MCFIDRLPERASLVGEVSALADGGGPLRRAETRPGWKSIAQSGVSKMSLAKAFALPCYPRELLTGPPLPLRGPPPRQGRHIRECRSLLSTLLLLVPSTGTHGRLRRRSRRHRNRSAVHIGTTPERASLVGEVSALADGGGPLRRAETRSGWKSLVRSEISSLSLAKASASPLPSSRAAHRTPSTIIRWPSSPTREALANLPQSHVCTAAAHPTDGDTPTSSEL